MGDGAEGGDRQNILKTRHHHPERYLLDANYVHDCEIIVPIIYF